MAQMAIPAQSAFASGVAELPTVLALLSTLAATRCSQHLSVRSETLDQRAGCGKSARPDPWEPSMSNHRGPPDRKADANTASSLRKRTSVRGKSDIWRPGFRRKRLMKGTTEYLSRRTRRTRRRACKMMRAAPVHGAAANRKQFQSLFSLSGLRVLRVLRERFLKPKMGGAC